MALFLTQHILTQGSLHYRLATQGYQKRNTYGVEKCVLIYYLWHDSMVYQWKRITINSLIQTKKLFINHWCRRNHANIPMNVFTIMNIVTILRRMFYVGIPMNVFGNKNVLMVQRCRFYASISMITFTIMNVLTMQRRRCCSFDSPGLARNEPTPGKRSQGDSTP
mgnify:CR=1 FL=1